MRSLGVETKPADEGGDQVRVITYGTFDMFHEGHRRLLTRAKALGDHLIVGVTTENYDSARGKLNVRQSLVERIRNVQDSGIADEIIVEEYEGQKISDIQRYDVDIFAIGSDWRGKFDILADYCEVVYLERTAGVSSTLLRNEANGILKFGVVGAGRIANRFVPECVYVSGVEVAGVYSRTPASAEEFMRRHELQFSARTYDELLDRVQAVYIASPHETHFDYARAAIERGVHVLCEKPLVLAEHQARHLHSLARSRGVVLLEGIKTAFAPGFQRMVAVARSGCIGEVRTVDATFTKLVTGDVRELHGQAGGSLAELASYPLLAITKLLGHDYVDLSSVSFQPPGSEVDLFSKLDLLYPHAVATAHIGLGVKAEGDLVVGGTKGYLYVPAPWWKTEYFEARFEDPADNKKFYYKYDGDGLRYEIAEFCSMVNERRLESFKLRSQETIQIARLIEHARAYARRFGGGRTTSEESLGSVAAIVRG